MSVLGLIPAKGKSQRLKRKNVLKLHGKSLLAWAADAAKESGICDSLIVSTEDEEIAEEAKSLGVEVPFLRPEKLAVDPAGVVEVALHALEELEKMGRSYETLVIMLPTCPLRTATDIKAAFDLFCKKQAQFLMSVTRYSHSPFIAMKIKTDGFMTPIFPDAIHVPSKQLPLPFRANGAIHILNIESFKREKSYYAEPLLAYEMPPERSIDIDHQEDFLLAESLLKKGIK